MSGQPPSRLPTPAQWRYAELIAAGCMSQTSAYRLLYPPRRGERSPDTERVSAARLAHSPAVAWAVARIRAGDTGPAKVERIKQKMRAVWKERALNRILRDGGRRADVLLAGREIHGPHPEEHPRKQAWRVFLRAARAVQSAKEPKLSAAEKIAIVFRHYAPPIVLPDLLIQGQLAALPLSSAASDPGLVELTEHIRDQQQAIEEKRAAAKPSCEPNPEPAGPQPGHFPHPLPPAASPDLPVVASTATMPSPGGRWEYIAIPGRFPPQRKRIWIAESTGED
jgi:hypothetical protein